MTSPRPTMGWREWIDFPDLGLGPVKAKVDTGARSSSLHAVDIELVRGRGGKRVRFRVYPLQRSAAHSLVCEVPLHDQRWIKSSNGQRELRPVIRTHVGWGIDVWEIDLTLTARDLMGFRMLLGREAIRSRYLVHAGRSFLGQKLELGVPGRRG